MLTAALTVLTASDHGQGRNTFRERVTECNTANNAPVCYRTPALVLLVAMAVLVVVVVVMALLFVVELVEVEVVLFVVLRMVLTGVMVVLVFCSGIKFTLSGVNGVLMVLVLI